MALPRQPRIEGEGLIHHVVGHSIPLSDAFPDNLARRGFLALVALAAQDLHWHVIAYCLLSNHYHLLVETELPNLGKGMRPLHGRHAQLLGRRMGHTGPLWRDRFHSYPVETASQVVQTAIYIDVNPVAARMCEFPDEWRWSSFRANAGITEPSSWHRIDHLYDHLGAERLGSPRHLSRPRCGGC